MTVCNKELGPISLLEMFFFEQEGLSLHTLGRRIDFESFMNPLCYLLPGLKLQGLRNVISDSKAPVWLQGPKGPGLQTPQDSFCTPDSSLPGQSVAPESSCVESCGRVGVRLVRRGGKRLTSKPRLQSSLL